MNRETFQTRAQLADVYLGQLQALALELEVVMDAVAANALSPLEESVSKQETLCSSLIKMTVTMNNESLQHTVPTNMPPNSSKVPAPEVEAAVEQKIHATKRAIQTLNQRYAALLKHSGESIALLACLCRSHTEPFQEARASRLKHQTWSCEM